MRKANTSPIMENMRKKKMYSSRNKTIKKESRKTLKPIEAMCIVDRTCPELKVIEIVSKKDAKTMKLGKGEYLVEVIISVKR